MGILKKLKKAASSALGTAAQLTTNALTGGAAATTKAATAGIRDVGSTVANASGGLRLYQDISGHTAKAQEDVRVAGVLAANKALAEGNADVDTSVADVILGETSDTAGTSLTELRKKRNASVATQVGIV